MKFIVGTSLKLPDKFCFWDNSNNGSTATIYPNSYIFSGVPNNFAVTDGVGSIFVIKHPSLYTVGYTLLTSNFIIGSQHKEGHIYKFYNPTAVSITVSFSGGQTYNGATSYVLYPNSYLDITKLEIYNIESNYNYEKINNLFSNFDTMSFINLIIDYKKLLNNGYNKDYLNQNLHTLLSLPFFLFLMTALAVILTLNTIQKSDNLKFIIIGLFLTVLIFYFRDLSLALGQTDRIPLILSVWAPVIILSFFSLIGVLQINEK